MARHTLEESAIDRQVEQAWMAYQRSFTYPLLVANGRVTIQGAMFASFHAGYHFGLQDTWKRVDTPLSHQEFVRKLCTCAVCPLHGDPVNGAARGRRKYSEEDNG